MLKMSQFIKKIPLSEDEKQAAKDEIERLFEELKNAKINYSLAKYELFLDEKGIVPMKTVVTAAHSKDVKYVVSPHLTEYAFSDAGFLRGYKILKDGSLGKVANLIYSADEVCGYYDEKFKIVWLSYPLNRPDDLNAVYAVADKNGVEYQTYCCLVNDDSEAGAVAAFPHVPNAEYFRKIVGTVKR